MPHSAEQLLSQVSLDSLDKDIELLFAPDPDEARLPEPELFAALGRELTEADLISLETSEKLGVEPQPIQSLRHTHHKVARLLALGIKEVEVSAITGYSPSRISILKSDPMFKELLGYYSDQVGQEHEHVVGKLAALTEDALDVIVQRLEAAPDKFTIPQLLEIVRSAGDRAGYAPVQRTENLSVTMTTEDLQKMKEDAHEANNVRPQRRSLSVEGGRVIEHATESNTEAKKIERQPSKGKNL